MQNYNNYKIVFGRGAFGLVRLGMNLLSTTNLDLGKLVAIKKTMLDDRDKYIIMKTEQYEEFEVSDIKDLI